MSKTGWKDVLGLAIKREEEAAATYHRLQGMATDAGVRQLLAELEEEERHHKRRLETLNIKDIEGDDLVEPEDIGLTDNLVVEPVSPELTLQDLLILAARKEKQAAELYASLARKIRPGQVKRLFRFLEKQEKSHKLRLELEYERHFLPED